MARLEEMLENGGGRWAVGAVAVVAVLGLVRRVGRPVVKSAIKGCLAVSESLQAAAGGLTAGARGIYDEARVAVHGTETASENRAGAAEPPAPRPARAPRPRQAGAASRSRAAKPAAREPSAAPAPTARPRRRPTRAAGETAAEEPAGRAAADAPAESAPARTTQPKSEPEESL